MPCACVASAMNCACMSVAKPGYSSVVTSAATNFFAAAHAELAVAFALNLDAAFPQFLDHGLQMAGLAMGEQQLAAGDRASDQKSAGLDAVRNHGVSRAVQFFDALHAQRGGPDAFDLRAHSDQQLSEIGNFRLQRGILENGFAFGQHRGSEEYSPCR